MFVAAQGVRLKEDPFGWRCMHIPLGVPLFLPRVLRWRCPLKCRGGICLLRCSFGSSFLAACGFCLLKRLSTLISSIVYTGQRTLHLVEASVAVLSRLYRSINLKRARSTGQSEAGSVRTRLDEFFSDDALTSDEVIDSSISLTGPLLCSPSSDSTYPTLL